MKKQIFNKCIQLVKYIKKKIERTQTSVIYILNIRRYVTKGNCYHLLYHLYIWTVFQKRHRICIGITNCFLEYFCSVVSFREILAVFSTSRQKLPFLISRIFWGKENHCLWLSLKKSTTILLSRCLLMNWAY